MAKVPESAGHQTAASSTAASHLVPASAASSDQSGSGRDSQPVAAGVGLLVRIWDCLWVEYLGTRGQLEAEGLLPAGLDWPDGQDVRRWEASGLRFQLSRTRPAGLKGPRRLWLEGDYWQLLFEPSDALWRPRRRVELKRKELTGEIHRWSEAGQHEWSGSFSRWLRAKHDLQFQAFKDRFVLKPRKPGRPARRRPDLTSGPAALPVVQAPARGQS